MSKQRLIKAIEAVNRRYLNGQNDDDQVKAMFNIAERLKGWYVMPLYDTYELCTDKERLAATVEKYGYWSEEVRYINNMLQNKGGYDYMMRLNNEVKAEIKEKS